MKTSPPRFTGPKAARGLSKSRYISGSQCHLRLWFDTHQRDFAPPADEVAQFVFDTGHEVGQLACTRYPGGRLIAQDHRHFDEAVDETRRLIGDDRVPALFEAAFEHEGVAVRADVIERLPEGGWRLVEVKSTTRVKEVFLLDTALQLWVLEGAGLDVRDACVLTLDSGFVRTQEPPDPHALFRLHTVLEPATALLTRVAADVGDMKAMLARAEPPAITPGEHCYTPYTCPYLPHCTRHAPRFEHGIDELPRLAAAKRDELVGLGIDEIRDIPADFPMSSLQHIIRRAVATNRDIVSGDLAATLARLEEPIHHLDFETFAPAIPRFVGTRPYASIPFLFSIHTEGVGTTHHEDYLHDGANDPRPMLAERLLQALGTRGSICVYSKFEHRVIRALMRAVPRREAALRRILQRLVDLYAIIRRHYYHPAFRGSLSLKSVLPALADTDYDDLSIADGQLASVRYMKALATDDEIERRTIFEDLRAYCARDTMATVEVLAAIRTRARRPGANTRTV